MPLPAEIQEWIAQFADDCYIDTGFANIGRVGRPDDPVTDPAEVVRDDRTFVLAGPMKMGLRAFIAAEKKNSGGIFAERITKETDCVVISATASKHRRTAHLGTKIERVRELVAAGSPMGFMSETARQGRSRLERQGLRENEFACGPPLCLKISEEGVHDTRGYSVLFPRLAASGGRRSA